MNHWRRIALVLTAVAVLVAAASALAWRSAAAPAAQPPPPAGLESPANPAAQNPDVPVPGGPAFLMISGFQFKPRWMGTTWDYQGLDLHNPGAGTSYLDASFSLPNDVVITGMVVYYYDNSASDLAVWLYRGDVSTGNFAFMADASSSGAMDQYRNVSDTTIDLPAVDQQSYSYIVTVEMPPAGNSLRLVGVRIDYATDVVTLPLALKDH